MGSLTKELETRRGRRNARILKNRHKADAVRIKKTKEQLDIIAKALAARS